MVRRAVLYQGRQTMPVTQTELRVIFEPAASVDFGLSAGMTARRSAMSSWSSWTLRPEPGWWSTHTGLTERTEASRWTSSSPRRAGRAPRRTKCCFTRSRPHPGRFKRQDVVEESWRIMQPLIDNPSPVHPYAPGSWGPAIASTLVADHGGWQGPWIVTDKG